MKTGVVFVSIFLITLPALAQEDPYFIDKRDFRKQYKTIALSPVDAVEIFNVSGSVAAALEEEITKRLERRGYTVLPSSVLGGIRAEMEQHVGGLEDPETGKVSPARQRAVRDHATRELWFRHDIDAIATIRVAIVDATFQKGRAEWDGASQKLLAEGRDRGYGGNIRASSVVLGIFDPSGRLLYLNYGGLELLQKRVEAKLLPLPASDYFADEKRVRKAAEISASEI